MSAELRGVLSWELTRSNEGHRDYHVSTLVVCDSADDGPQTVMNCTDLYQIGDIWNLGNDNDEWALCTPFMRATPVVIGEPNFVWKVDQVFSTKSQFMLQRCQDTPIEDPLLEPYGISGSFVRYVKEATLDRFGNRIITSSFEPIRGAGVAFDNNKPVVSISMNVPALDLDIFSSMVDTVNGSAMWGLSPRCVKLDNVSWQRFILGTCDYYYTRQFDFSVDFNTFDRNLDNACTLALYGHHDETSKMWVVDNIDSGSGPAPPDPTNPQHYVRYKDANDENAKVFLDPATGLPWDGDDADIPKILVEYYSESDFFLLGIPTSF